MKSKHQFILTLSLGAALAGPACLAAEEPDAEARLPRMSESQVVAEVEKALPKWDKDVLSVPNGPKWSARVQFDGVLKAVGDPPLKAAPPKNTRRVVDGERVVRVIPEQGVVRYVNNALNWNPDKSEKLLEKEAALRTADKTLELLGLPRPELDKPRVDTQGARDTSNTSPADSRTFEMYRLVTVRRQIKDLPVLGSRARVAVAGSGGIQRLRVNWPPFSMGKGLRLRQRDAVAKDVVARIMQQDPVSLVGVPGSDLTKFISAKLAYAPQEMTRPYRRQPAGKDNEKPVDESGAPDADDNRNERPVQFQSAAKVASPVLYVPVLLVTVAASPTPYELVVPVAESG